MLTLLSSQGLASPPDCPVDQALALIASRRATEARELLQPCASVHAGDAPVAIAYAQVLLALRDEKGAVRALERAAAAHPSDSELQLWLGRAYGQRAMHAAVFEQPSLAVKVRKAFERAVALDPENLEARSGLLEYLVRAPSVLGGSYPKARDQAEEIEKRDPVKGARAFGRVAEQEKRWVEADQIYQRAAAEFPDRPEPVLWRAVLAANLRNFSKAFDLLETLVARQPREWLALYEIGRTSGLSGEKLDRGEEALKLYLGHDPGPDDPSFAQAHLRLADVYQKKGDRSRAREEYAEALRLDPGLTEARAALAKRR